MKALKDNLIFHNHPLPNSKLERGTCWNCKHCQGRRNHRNSDWVSRCETRIVWNHSGRKPRILNTRLPWKDEHLEIKFVHACSVPDGSTCWWSLCCSIPFFARSQGSFFGKKLCKGHSAAIVNLWNVAKERIIFRRTGRAHASLPHSELCSTECLSLVAAPYRIGVVKPVKSLFLPKGLKMITKNTKLSCMECIRWRIS